MFRAVTAKPLLTNTAHLATMCCREHCFKEYGISLEKLVKYRKKIACDFRPITGYKVMRKLTGKGKLMQCPYAISKRIICVTFKVLVEG